MATKEQLKGYFSTGKIPTAANFAELIDSSFNDIDAIPNVISCTNDVNSNDPYLGIITTTHALTCIMMPVIKSSDNELYKIPAVVIKTTEVIKAQSVQGKAKIGTLNTNIYVIDKTIPDIDSVINTLEELTNHWPEGYAFVKNIGTDITKCIIEFCTTYLTRQISFTS